MPRPPQNPFRFLRLLGEEEAGWLREPEGWKWVHTLGHPCEPPLHAPVYEKFIHTRGNTHAPAHREIMFTLSGEGVFGLQGKVYRRSAGTVFLFDHYESRDSKAVYSYPYTALWIHLRERHSLSYNTIARDSRGKSYRAISTRLMADEFPPLIMDAWDQCRAAPGDAICRAFLKSLITSLLLKILGTASPDPMPDQHKQIIKSIQEYIHHHLSDPLNLNSLAHIAGYSPFFFHRLFTRYTGSPPKEYIDQARLERAKELLKQNYTLEAIAQQIGMASAYSFSRFFKKKTTRSPRRWSQHAP
ncbi:MAG TPA: AraC family transcriptional regulator [Chthoniobacteraceae bacterium]|nr:AraC family transcriptional regulator [Chthoniobacteraceae bacterium]